MSGLSEDPINELVKVQQHYVSRNYVFCVKYFENTLGASNPCHVLQNFPIDYQFKPIVQRRTLDRIQNTRTNLVFRILGYKKLFHGKIHCGFEHQNDLNIKQI
jgi:hypothetical protein